MVNKLAKVVGATDPNEEVPAASENPDEVFSNLKAFL
jgi:hypothetical protein